MEIGIKLKKVISKLNFKQLLFFPSCIEQAGMPYKVQKLRNILPIV